MFYSLLAILGSWRKTWFIRLINLQWHIWHLFHFLHAHQQAISFSSVYCHEKVTAQNIHSFNLSPHMTKKWSLRLEKNTSSFISRISNFLKDEPGYLQDNSHDLGHKNQVCRFLMIKKKTCWKRKGAHHLRWEKKVAKASLCRRKIYNFLKASRACIEETKD